MANMFALFLAGIGLYGAMKIHLCFVGTHGILSVSGLGTFFVFLVLELLFFPGRDDDSKLMAVMALPYLVDLIVGISSVLLYAKMKEALTRELFPFGQQGLVTEPLLLHPGEQCAVCQDKKNECAFYPCGHKCVCKGCANLLVHGLCPLCRKTVRDYIVVYE